MTSVKLTRDRAVGLLTLNAFAASDYLVIPLQCEYFALEGISMINRVLAQVREHGFPQALPSVRVALREARGSPVIRAERHAEHVGDHLVSDALLP